ncbi:conserved Plasmodium protein, unknown function [Plasmodium malariae]|uniref:BSD domain-containing protein n=1 Tax=Plasmodium malariae TaxID=5858 RepID=A0A1C3KYB4_PLAMA|nr:conserved Plasmodium protein, unknown function [Plasmodium malariae]
MEEEKIVDMFEVLYNNEKGELYITNKYFIFISEKTKKVKVDSKSLFLIDDIDLKVCILSWRKTEKSKKTKKIRFSFAIRTIKNNFCFHDYNNTELYIFEFFNDKDYNSVSDLINYLNKGNLKSHLYIDFNLNLLSGKYKVFEDEEVIDGSEEYKNISSDRKKELHKVGGGSNNVGDAANNIGGREINTGNNDNKISGSDNNVDSNDNIRSARGKNTEGRIDIPPHHGSKSKGEKPKTVEEKYEEIEKNKVIPYLHSSSDENNDNENDKNLKKNDCFNALNKVLESDTRLKSLYDMCIENNILDKEEFYKLHKNDIYEHRNVGLSADTNILKEPIYITEEQKNSKSVEINKELSKLILSENTELKKLYDYYTENNILNESKFWFFLFNNKYSHLFFYDKNEKEIMGNKNFLNIKEENSFENLSYNVENLNQDIKGTLEKCILKEYLSTKSYNRKNILFKNNYYFNEENVEGFGVFTNEKLIKNNNSLNLLINKFNNYCISMIKDKKFTLDKFYDDLKNKVEDTDLNPVQEKKELHFNLENKKKSLSHKEYTNNELSENKNYLNKHFPAFMHDLKNNRPSSKKNYSDLYNIGRHLFVLNTKKCQNNQSLLIGTIEYDQHILDIVKDYHMKINYLLNLFYTSYIPEQNKRNKILENLSRIKDEIQAKQEEYNSVLIMGKPLLIHLFEQISICKKFNEKLHKYIEEKRKKA